MPYALKPPRVGYSPYYRVRGTEQGIYLDKSTGVSDRKIAQRMLAEWRSEAQRQAITGPKKQATFAEAALSYMQSGRSRLFLAPLIKHFGETPLDQIDQIALDKASSVLGPKRAPQTNNRLVYTPTIAILRHASVHIPLKRPKIHSEGHRIEWLKPEEAFSLLRSAADVDRRLGALLTFLLYTGVRLSEALRLEWRDVDLSAATALIRETKNGQPITAYLTPEVVDAMGNIRGTPESGRPRVFRITKCGRLYKLLGEAVSKANVELPLGSAFHILRHTHITWRRLYAGQDTRALLDVGLHKSPRMVERYTHLSVTDEARKADLLPTPTR